MTAEKRAYVERAQRFPFRFPLRYLKSRIAEWQEGETVNISRSGILFSAGEILPIDSELEIRVRFPTNATLSCRGSIVRSHESDIAVRIDKSSLSRSASS